jgi:hypothetical protein
MFAPGVLGFARQFNRYIQAMFIRISIVVAILAALGVGVINFVSVKEKITVTRAERDSEKNQKVEAQNSLAKTTKDLEKTTADLNQTKNDLATAVTEKDRALSERDVAAKRATQLAEDLSKAKQARDDALANLEAYRLTGLTPQEILAMKGHLKTTQDNLVGAMEENKKLNRKVTSLNYELKKYRDEKVIVYLPSTLKGEVVVADPKWDFVVLSVGEEHGIIKDGELLVSREGKLVAKVVVSSVQKDRCVANVMPGWKLGEVMEKDQVIPAHPAL